MPGGHEGRGGSQVRFSDNMDWWCSLPQPRDDLETIPFIGDVAGETPAVCKMTEVRRRDIGTQAYGSGIPTLNGTLLDKFGLLAKQKPNYKQVATSHGDVNLSQNVPDLGFMPTADSLLFLKHEYLGSRAPVTPQRFFPTR